MMATLRHHLLMYISHHTKTNPIIIVTTSSHSDLCEANDTVHTLDWLLFRKESYNMETSMKVPCLELCTQVICLHVAIYPQKKCVIAVQWITYQGTH